ncbi:MAG: ribonuclease Z, partial [Roseivirga sp.]
GHFSVRYRELEPIRDEARTVFENADLAIEGEEFILED